MTIKLNKKQREFLQMLLDTGYGSSSKRRFANILESGVYHGDLNSFYTPPNRCGKSDKFDISRAIARYKEAIKSNGTRNKK